MRVVLDTNVFVSALVSVGMPPAQILDLWRAGSLELVVSPDIVDEYQRVLTYPKVRRRLRYTDEEVLEVITALMIEATIVLPTETPAVAVNDPSDDKFIAAAMVAKASFVISGDHHLLQLGSYEGIAILKPVDFLALYRGESQL